MIMIGAYIYSQEHHKLWLLVVIVCVILQLWLEWHQVVLTADVQHVVYSPVNLSHPAGWVEQALDHVH